MCPPGLQGNPLVACIEAGCSQNTDCATDEKCGFVPGSQFTRKECQPLCNPGKCAIGADCTARDHRESCKCRFPLQGDGYAACVERKCIKMHQTESDLELHVFFIISAIISEEPECRVDKDCPPQMTCMRETCQNPCIVSNPCTSSQKCVVTDTFSSIRSVACICPSDHYLSSSGTCIPGIFHGVFQKLIWIVNHEMTNFLFIIDYLFNFFKI